jgi:2-polyprenyl-3-methyl-5-hydroxy-6-metoxy-1,4-benzoquinol methylase
MSTSALEKYLIKSFPGSSHSWATKVIDNLIQNGSLVDHNSAVLDVGSGSGFIGAYLRSKCPQLSVDAIEIDEQAAVATKHLYRSLVNDISDLPTNQQYAVIFLLDILEHLIDPEDFLHKISHKLSEGGYILASVPNVAHWAVRVSLLLGQFNYTSRGILDRTHLRFFTRRTFLSLLKSIPKTVINQTSGSIGPAEFVIPSRYHQDFWFRALATVRIMGVFLWPSLCAFQHLAVIQKRQ